MRKRIFKLISIFSIFLFIFSLSSCDIDLSKLFTSDTDTEIKVKDETNNNDNDQEKSDDGGNEEKEEIINEKTDPEELKILDYLLDYENDYGYIELGKDETYGADMQKIYVLAYNEAKKMLISADDYNTKSINGSEVVELGKFDVNSSKFNDNFDIPAATSAIMEMIYDNPLFYFLRPGCSFSYTYYPDNPSVHIADYISLNANKEYAKASDRTIMNNAILTVIADFMDKSSLSEKNDYQKAKAINHYIMDRIEYAYISGTETPETAYWAHNLEGFINENYKKGVCECYSRSYLLLSKVCNITSIQITGYANNNPASGHAWNYTKIDGNWYGIDVTWNDTTTSMFNKDGDYFLVSDSQMKRSGNEHTPYNNLEYGQNYRVNFPTLSQTNYIPSIL